MDVAFETVAGNENFLGAPDPQVAEFLDGMRDARAEFEAGGVVLVAPPEGRSFAYGCGWTEALAAYEEEGEGEVAVVGDRRVLLRAGDSAWPPVLPRF